MEDGAKRLDARRPEFGDEGSVEGDALFVDRALFIGDDARPGDGEAIALEAQLLHDGDVFFETVIVIAGNIAVFVAFGVAFIEGVPDAEHFAVLVVRAFDLMDCRRGAPEEIVRE